MSGGLRLSHMRGICRRLADDYILLAPEPRAASMDSSQSLGVEEWRVNTGMDTGSSPADEVRKSHQGPR